MCTTPQKPSVPAVGVTVESSGNKDILVFHAIVLKIKHYSPNAEANLNETCKRKEITLSSSLLLITCFQS